MLLCISHKYKLRFDDVTMLTQPYCNFFVKLVKWGANVEMIYFGDHGPSAPLAAHMALWQLYSTVQVLDNDYWVFASLLRTQNFSIST